MSKITVTEDQLFWMFRYCLSRRTYASEDGVNAVCLNWQYLSKKTKKQIIDEINEAMYCHECDNEPWRRVILIDLQERLNQERNSDE